jgi:3-phenylpropionate/trans-cinnamate dioxygenase ferredoxin subunit
MTPASARTIARRYEVAKVSEIPPGEKKLVEAGGKSIGVFNLHGTFYALRNVCPHKGAELCKGLIKPWVSSPEPGKFVFEREGEIIRCPWHSWEFEIKTGCMIVDPATRTKSYEVVVEHVDVEVEDDRIIVII